MSWAAEPSRDGTNPPWALGRNPNSCSPDHDYAIRSRTCESSRRVDSPTSTRRTAVVRRATPVSRTDSIGRNKHRHENVAVLFKPHCDPHAGAYRRGIASDDVGRHARSGEVVQFDQRHDVGSRDRWMELLVAHGVGEYRAFAAGSDCRSRRTTIRACERGRESAPPARNTQGNKEIAGSATGPELAATWVQRG